MSDTDINPNAFKHMYNQAFLKRMSDALVQVYPAFDTKHFNRLMPELIRLEMKPRVRFIREELKRQLPADFKKAVKILLKTAEGGSLTGFDLWPYSDFIQTYGLEDLEVALDAMRELTLLFSSEFAVRPFLIRYPDQTLRYLEKCAKDPSVDVRRWASEGSRPRLPWGERLHQFVKDPSHTLPILETLKFDEELYVRKSVSNHLNDIAKDHPERVIKILSAWKKQSGTKHAVKIEWIIHRALRTLIKAGHPGALKLIGVSNDAAVKVSGLTIGQKSYRLGDRIEFSFRIKSQAKKPQKIVADYIVHYMKSNGSTAPKVFKLTTVTLAPMAELVVSKNHHLKKVTTRVHYSGTHLLEIQVNGRAVGRVRWDLKV